LQNVKPGLLTYRPDMVQGVDRMHRNLLDALSTGWIEQALGVSRTAVSDWRRGKFPERRRAQLVEAVHGLLSEREESAPPIGTERLLTGVIALENRAQITPEERAVAEAEALLLLKGLLEADETPLQR
jgi:hypothetical protein